MDVKFITEGLACNKVESFMIQNTTRLFEFIGVMLVNTDIKLLKSLSHHYSDVMKMQYRNGLTVLEYFGIYSILKRRMDLLKLCMYHGYDINTRTLITLRNVHGSIVYYKVDLPCSYDMLVKLNAWHYHMDGFSQKTTMTLTPCMLALLQLGNYGIIRYLTLTPECNLLARITRYEFVPTIRVKANDPITSCENPDCPLLKRRKYKGPTSPLKRGVIQRKLKFFDCYACSFAYQPARYHSLQIDDKLCESLIVKR